RCPQGTRWVPPFPWTWGMEGRPVGSGCCLVDGHSGFKVWSLRISPPTSPMTPPPSRLPGIQPLAPGAHLHPEGKGIPGKTAQEGRVEPVVIVHPHVDDGPVRGLFRLDVHLQPIEVQPPRRRLALDALEGAGGGAPLDGGAAG